MVPLYETFSKNGRLCFKINSGQFKDIVYRYEKLSENNKLEYKILKKATMINKDNKYLFEQEIRKILDNKLKLNG